MKRPKETRGRSNEEYILPRTTEQEECKSGQQEAVFIDKDHWHYFKQVNDLITTELLKRNIIWGTGVAFSVPVSTSFWCSEALNFGCG